MFRLSGFGVLGLGILGPRPRLRFWDCAVGGQG